MAAGFAEIPEASEHTSIKERLEHVEAQGRIEDLKAAQKGSFAGSEAAAGLEESIWLCPIEDRRRLDSRREGMLEGFSLGRAHLHVSRAILCADWERKGFGDAVCWVKSRKPKRIPRSQPIGRPS